MEGAHLKIRTPTLYVSRNSRCSSSRRLAWLGLGSKPIAQTPQRRFLQDPSRNSSEMGPNSSEKAAKPSLGVFVWLIQLSNLHADIGAHIEVHRRAVKGSKQLVHRRHRVMLQGGGCLHEQVEVALGDASSHLLPGVSSLRMLSDVEPSPQARWRRRATYSACLCVCVRWLPFQGSPRTRIIAYTHTSRKHTHRTRGTTCDATGESRTKRRRSASGSSR